MTDNIGVYVHIPFCIRKCNYCDFCSYPNQENCTVDRYIEALKKEIYAYKTIPKIKADTIYFGGGTPSLLSGHQLKDIFIALFDVFDFSGDCEITLEANPGTIEKEKIRAYKSLGINRISMGLQSIHEKELKKLGRIHTYEDFLNSYNTVINAGIDNINVDLMYAIPYQTRESFNNTLNSVIRLSPKHISSYSLIVEPGTPFYKEKNKLILPDEDTECLMYYDCIKTLENNGYSHYEISNYAKSGYESQHNLKYWRNQNYIGFGVSAHSYYKNKRYANISSLDEYLKNSEPQYEHGELIDKENERFEFAMMRLRLKEGFSLKEYKSRYGVDFLKGKEKYIKEFTEKGLLSVRDDIISITEKGVYLSNTILSSIL